MAEQTSGHLVVVVGAGPAGIYGTRKLADAGHQVIIINRDIKPGGLVEYGIYWNKHKMKEGIRAQFRKIFADPHIHYVGNVKIGHQADLTLDELRDLLKPTALIVAAGAQGTKSLSLKGEEAQGVFHAKDLVYHYNGLPPFSQQHFPIGQRVAVIGIGNVMVDIAHWLVHDLKTPEVIAIARRGPAQRAYTDNEIKAVAANIDIPALQAELERVGPHIHVDREGMEKLFKDLTKYAHEPGKEGQSPTRLSFRYLSAPTEILADETGRVCALRMEDTTLMPKGDDFSARGLATYHDLAVDTVIFAVGDRVDEKLGLPFDGSIYVKNTAPDPEYPGAEAYQVFDPHLGRKLDGVFVIGWSRQASDGLVGKAKLDGERGINFVNQFLEKATSGTAEDTADKLNALRQLLAERGVRTVNFADVLKLESIEKQEAASRGLEFYKFSANDEMLKALAE